MATLGGLPTIVEAAKRRDPNGMPAKIAEVLHESTPILDDIPWVPGNLTDGHRSTIRVGLPEVHLRAINEGVAASRSTTSQITDGTSIVEAWSNIDEKLVNMESDRMAFRLSEATAFIEAMGQKVTDLLFNGSVADDTKEFNGLYIRPQFTDLGNQCLSAGGSSNLSSIWLIGWGREKVFGMHPKNLPAGLQHYDAGVGVVQIDNSGVVDATTGQMLAYRSRYTWDCGIVVKDARYIVRIANIDIALALAVTGTQDAATPLTNVISLMGRATHRIPNLKACRPCFYMAPTLLEALDVQHTAATRSNALMTREVQGEMIYSFRNIPCKAIDALGYQEDLVSV